MTTPNSSGPVTGAPSEPAEGGNGSTLPIGFSLAEFQIEKVIGDGGFGIVYLALDTQLGRKVAIKEYMPASLAGRREDYSVTVTSNRHRETFDLGLRSFVKEAITLARFDHPALLKVFRFWEERGTAYMVMPYLEGQTLKQYLRAQASPPTEEWLRGLLDPVLDGLEHLHANNILHRDIAPDNIQLLPGGAPLLLDFGAARQVIGDATQALTVILKPGFAPIEQYAESPTMKQGPWTDIYALAAVVYFAISGKAPRPSVARVMVDDMSPATEVGGGRYSPQFLAFVDACLRVRAEDRPQNVAQARRLLFDSRTVALVSAAPPPNAPEVDDEDQRTIIRTSAPSPIHGPAALVPRTTPPTQPPPTQPRTQAAVPAPVPPPFVAPEASAQQWAAPAMPPAARRRNWLAGVAVVMLAGIGVAVWKTWPSDTPIPTAAPAESPTAVLPAVEPAALPKLIEPAVPMPPATAAAPSLPAVATSAASEAGATPIPAQAVVAEPPPAAARTLPVVATTAPPAQRPANAKAPTRATAAAPATPPRADTQKECARLLQQASLGQEAPDLAHRLAELNCK